LQDHAEAGVPRNHRFDELVIAIYEILEEGSHGGELGE
jgi:hypothetical protein